MAVCSTRPDGRKKGAGEVRALRLRRALNSLRNSEGPLVPEEAASAGGSGSGFFRFPRATPSGGAGNSEGPLVPDEEAPPNTTMGGARIPAPRHGRRRERFNPLRRPSLVHDFVFDRFSSTPKMSLRNWACAAAMLLVFS